MLFRILVSTAWSLSSKGALLAATVWMSAQQFRAWGPVTVAPNVQNRSIGRILMQAVVERPPDRGFAGIRLLAIGYASAFTANTRSREVRDALDQVKPLS
jgi:predicted N-acetyltransferase YhbS